MCNITFEVPRLSTFVFKKFSEKKVFTIIFVVNMVKSLKGFGWNNVGPAPQTVAQHYFTIGPIVSCYPGSGLRGIKRQCTSMAVVANMGQSLNPVSMLSQRRIRLTAIKTAMGCDAGPTTNRYRVLVLCVPGTSYRLSRTMTYQWMSQYVQQ